MAEDRRQDPAALRWCDRPVAGRPGVGNVRNNRPDLGWSAPQSSSSSDGAERMTPLVTGQVASHVSHSSSPNLMPPEGMHEVQHEQHKDV